MKIIVKVPLSELRHIHHPVYIGMRVLKALRERGVPARGNLAVEGIEVGTLSMHETVDDLVYTWDSTPVAGAAQPVVYDDDEI